MGFIEREEQRLSAELLKISGTERDTILWHQLYAARQALVWALEPGAVRYPYDMIMGTEKTENSYSLPVSEIPIARHTQAN